MRERLGEFRVADPLIHEPFAFRIHEDIAAHVFKQPAAPKWNEFDIGHFRKSRADRSSELNAVTRGPVKMPAARVRG